MFSPKINIYLPLYSFILAKVPKIGHQVELSCFSSSCHTCHDFRCVSFVASHLTCWVITSCID